MEIPPHHQRTPRHLTAAQAQDALTELDAKLDTLRRRAQATAAESAATHTYHEHIAGLERKRALLHTNFVQARPAPEGHSVWQDLKTGIDTLRHDLAQLLD